MFLVGVGLYLLYDWDEVLCKMRFNVLFSVLVIYQVMNDWVVSLCFNCVVIGNNKDQDMFMVGLVCNF